MTEQDNAGTGKSWAELLDLTDPSPKIEEKHYVRWFLDDGVDFEVECQHEQFPDNYLCSGEAAMDDKSLFPEYFHGERTPLRDGPIRFWWEGSGEDSELFWEYEDESPLPVAEQK